MWVILFPMYKDIPDQVYYRKEMWLNVISTDTINKRQVSSTIVINNKFQGLTVSLLLKIMKQIKSI